MPTSSSPLARVKVSSDRVIGHVAGLRPFRPSGFVVKSEKFDKKTIIYNYGHGGCGVTLCWGTAQLALEEAVKTGQEHFAVLGCGVVGLATARLLQNEGFKATIYAKELPPNTTSNVAAAVWFPVTFSETDKLTGDNLPSDFADTFLRACRFSHRYFQNLVGDNYGVRWLTIYFLSSRDLSQSHRMRTIEQFPDLFSDTVLHREPRKFYGFPLAQRFRTLMIEPDVYLNALVCDFQEAGGTVVTKEFHTQAELAALPERVIVNCTGLGTRKLFNDNELVPVKGQLTLLLPQPDIDYGYVVVDPDTDLYMFPRSDGILLGGTHERGEWSLEPDPKHVQRIVEGHERIARAAT